MVGKDGYGFVSSGSPCPPLQGTHMHTTGAHTHIHTHTTHTTQAFHNPGLGGSRDFAF